ncbi:uncharacterized protein LOC127536066 [Acanthochromis polyacanthus]|uniref:uncharacterized protein LOC127536066 n=1 Tax=Acanthochromis polyacanthus TaxID=80966 RepID=UPI002234425E|nr:uncharacterized protein LOC127536066 [Acanthochromis polyacanthus]
MKVFHTFFCFLFIALQDGKTGLLNSNLGLRTVMEGEDITVECPFTISGNTKKFCLEKCEEGNILIETTEDTAEKDRYRIRYEHKTFPSDNILHVSIKQLKKSDSGWYRCALGRSLLPDSSEDFQIVVKAASTTSQPKSTLPTFPPSTFLPSSSTATTPTEESLSSTSGTSKPPSASTEDNGKPDSSSGTSSDCDQKFSSTFKDHIYIQSSRVYDETREDRQISSPPVETSSIYCNAKYTKPNRAEDTDDYSFVSFPASKI